MGINKYNRLGFAVGRRFELSSSWSLTAVILVVVVSAELLTVVSAAHQSSPAASVTVIDSPVSSSVTVTLALTTGILWSAAPPPVKVGEIEASRARSREPWDGAGSGGDHS